MSPPMLGTSAAACLRRQSAAKCLRRLLLRRCWLPSAPSQGRRAAFWWVTGEGGTATDTSTGRAGPPYAPSEEFRAACWWVGVHGEGGGG